MKLFKNALIYDGTGGAPFKGDILIENDKIIKVEKSIDAEAEWKVIDLEGLSISSGFIDAHSHNDWFAIRKEPEKYLAKVERQHINNLLKSSLYASGINS